jgi:ubiquinone/menaquinone biosynthesis C-methylase UbiE
MNETRSKRREQFLSKMSKEIIASYEDPYRDWDDDEKVFLPQFLALVGSKKRILDLAGGYAKAAPHLLKDGNSVVLADLSTHSLRDGRKALASIDVQFVRMDMLLDLPFEDGVFDGVWFSEAFEYVPPDKRAEFLGSLRRIVKDRGIVFMNAEGLSKDTTRFTYLKNYLYWKIMKRAPVMWGEYIYKLDLPGYKGWHYHSLTLSKKIEKTIRAAGFEIVTASDFGKREYNAFLLRAVRPPY